MTITEAEMASRTFGCELEYEGISQERAAKTVAEVTGGTARFEGYHLHNWTVTMPDGRKWQVVSDGSLCGTSAEVVTPIMTVADLGLPVILYNVPGRAGKEIPLDVVVRLAKHPNVIAIKEAAGSVDRVSAIKSLLPDFTVLSGDDSLALPMMSVGAEGVISVASNVIPKEMGDMVRLALEGRFVEARAYHAKYYRLFHDLFIDVNPVMVKEALALQKKIERVFRLPLCETDDAKLAQMKKTLSALDLI